MDRAQILTVVCECLASLNRERAADQQIPVSETTALLADGSKLDSLAFVSFATDLEDRLVAATGRDLMLAAAALSSEENPFRSVATLVDHIVRRLEEP